MKRKIKYLVVHCTASTQNAKVESILNYWKSIGWKRPGYHYIIRADGSTISLHPEDLPSNGVAGFNNECLNISYIGGIDKENKPLDNRTEAQKSALIKLLKELRLRYPEAQICGHRDFPEVKKACPCFNAKEEYKHV